MSEIYIPTERILAWKSSTGYRAIKNIYRDRKAERSGVPLINHIDEGLEVLASLGATWSTAEAYCLHPLYQDFEDLKVSYKSPSFFDPTSILLTMEYRNKANSYLCRPDTDHFERRDIEKAVGELLPEVRHMLIADKVQNQKDFIAHHYKKHKRSDQLNRYFILWLEFLDAPKEAFQAIWK